MRTLSWQFGLPGIRVPADWHCETSCVHSLAWTQEVTAMNLDPRKLAAEFIGTLILVVVAVGVATESFGFKLFGGTFNLATGTGLNGSIAAGVVATALAFGLVLVALVYAIGPISGCHINPAVTLGFIATGRMKLAEGVAYI